MDPPADRDLPRERELFFKRTRTPVVALYLSLGLGGVATGVYACSMELQQGSIGIAIGLVAMVFVRLLDTLIAISAKATRSLILVLIPLATVATFLTGDVFDWLFETALGLGIFAGGMLGIALGTALLRRKLAHDDDLWLRQKQLGFDPARPFDWIRGGSEGD